MSPWELDEAVATFKTAQVQLSGREPATQAELDRLALLPMFEYAQERKTAAERFQVPVSMLDQVIAERRRALAPAGVTGSGRPLNLPVIELADDPVNGEKVLECVIDTLSRYVVLPPHAALAIALWIFRAHADDCFDINPRLTLLSPEKRCGKTTLLSLIAKLVPRALPTSNVTPSVIFRTIEAEHPTLLIDEIDSFQDAHEELRGILNSGHQRDTAQIIRNVGDNHEPRVFSTWCPMVLAAIGHLPGTIEDRSVIVAMRRRAPHEPLRKLRWETRVGRAIRATLHTVARNIARWVFDHHSHFNQTEPTVPDSLNDRAADNWTPLLAIAEVIGGEWVERARAAAMALSGENETDTASHGIHLLEDIRALFQEKVCDRFGLKELCECLAEIEERPWGQWGRQGKPVTPHQLGKLLRPYEIKSKPVRKGSEVSRGYHLDQFEDAFFRYLLPLNPSPHGENLVSPRYGVTTHASTGDTSLFDLVTDPSCNYSENGTNPAPRADCNRVTPQNVETQPEEDIVEEGPC